MVVVDGGSPLVARMWRVARGEERRSGVVVVAEGLGVGEAHHEPTDPAGFEPAAEGALAGDGFEPAAALVRLGVVVEGIGAGEVEKREESKNDL